MKIVSVVGARPQFVKLAPVAAAIAEAAHQHLVIHTGQHYDKNMSEVFFTDLGIASADVNLSVGSGSHGRQTGEMLAAIEGSLEELSPDWVLTYGDTNSTVAGALAAAKMRIPVAHLEAGLRSFNRSMPEEINRLVADHISDLCLAPTTVAVEHLAREGLMDRTVHVGDVMTDVLFKTRAEARNISDAALRTAVSGASKYFFATVHRPSNTDHRERLASIIEALANLPHLVVLAAHPRLRSNAERFGLDLDRGNIRLVQPLTYPDLVLTVQNSAGVITDSGGLQKEAFNLRVPCTTVRSETEWTETVSLGWNVLVPQPELLSAAATRPWPAPTSESPYGDGNAAQAVVAAMEASQS